MLGLIWSFDRAIDQSTNQSINLVNQPLFAPKVLLFTIWGRCSQQNLLGFMGRAPGVGRLMVCLHCDATSHFMLQKPGWYFNRICGALGS